MIVVARLKLMLGYGFPGRQNMAWDVSERPSTRRLTQLLVFGGLGLPACGVFGAGLAYTLTAFAALVMLAAVICVSPQGDFGSMFHYPFVLDRGRYGAVIQLGIPFACRMLLREGVLPAAAFMIAPFGASALAAHAVAGVFSAD